jgi:hypothetical protein
MSERLLVIWLDGEGPGVSKGCPAKSDKKWSAMRLPLQEVTDSDGT